MKELDLTPILAENLRRLRHQGRKELLLVLKAENCAGCETLDAQLRRPALGRLLAGRTYVVALTVGDLHGELPEELRLHSVRLRTPGYPTTLAFRVLDEALQLLALALGPLDEQDPEGTVADMLECRSWVVPEAQGARLEWCAGGLCVPLHRANKFRADLRVVIGPQPH